MLDHSSPSPSNKLPDEPPMPAGCWHAASTIIHVCLGLPLFILATPSLTTAGNLFYLATWIGIVGVFPAGFLLLFRQSWAWKALVLLEAYCLWAVCAILIQSFRWYAQRPPADEGGFGDLFHLLTVYCTTPIIAMTLITLSSLLTPNGRHAFRVEDFWEDLSRSLFRRRS
jgi:hypothetical protein